MWLGAALGCTSAEAKERFDSIVGVADAPQDRRYHRGLPSNWTRLGWDAGILPPVYFVATKCQDPQLRKKAVALLLKTAPHLGQDIGLVEDSNYVIGNCGAAL
jgi:hypothetical protein